MRQNLNRDTQQFAFKRSVITIDGETRDVFKEPVTDPGEPSKRGRLALARANRGYVTVREGEAGADVLREVFRDGELLLRDSWEDVRARVRID